MMTTGEAWAITGSGIASLMFLWTVAERFFPHHFRGYAQHYLHKIVSHVYPFVQITFDEFTGDHFKRSDAYVMIQNYLREHAATTAKKLKAEEVTGAKALLFCMDDREEVIDEFRGVKIWWRSDKKTPRHNSSYFAANEDRRFYTLTFHKSQRRLITEVYIQHVLQEGKSSSVKNRQLKLYTNKSGRSLSRTNWSHALFEHPATFDTLAMEKKKKEEIKKDLLKFSRGKDYYNKIGKPWKRGYLLYGPPGTGKSTMIAAMANFLNYDIYDLELTTVKDNTELRRMLIDTSSKSIIVIEDIDCSLDLTRQRKEKKSEEEVGEPRDQMNNHGEGKDNKSNVTLSGLLNFIDGLWSGSAGERIIVFTTNFIEKLDPALIRRGRMDKHIEMSYCCYEGFEVLAKNYLDIESHELFDEIRKLLEERKMAPADVAEHLMPKSEEDDEDICLKRLIGALKDARREVEVEMEVDGEARRRAEEEDKGIGARG